MKCKHEVNYLVGNADGVLCRKCGKLFPNFDALKAELDADRTEQDAPAPEAPSADPAEKPKRGRKKKEV